MDFENLNVIPIEQRKKKEAGFRITPIDDIVAWRKVQESKEYLHRLKLGERDERIDDFWKSTGSKPASPVLNGRGWADKLKEATEEKKRIADAVKSIREKIPAPLPLPPPISRLTRIKKFIQRVWHSANF